MYKKIFINTSLFVFYTIYWHGPYNCPYIESKFYNFFKYIHIKKI